MVDLCLIDIAQQLAEMAVLPLDPPKVTCTECTPKRQCWAHQQFHRAPSSNAEYLGGAHDHCPTEHA